MDNRTPDNADTYPALGRAFLWLDRPGGAKAVRYTLFILCALLIVADFVFYKKGYLPIEEFPIFYALFGFFSCAALLICSVVMRVILERPRDYYAPTDGALEPSPQEQAAKVDHHA